MSRQARKLLRQKEEELLSKGVNDEQQIDVNDDDDDGTPVKAPPAKVNLFGLIGGDDDEGDVGAEQQDEPEEVEVKPAPSSSQKRNRKKKAKRKGPATAAAVDHADDEPEADTAKTSNQDDDGLDEIDKALQELGSSSSTTSRPTTTATTTTTAAANKKGLLAVDPKYLNAEEELKRLFGSKIVADEAKKGKNNARNQPKLRRNLLVNPRETWPRMESRTGISMEMIEGPNREDKAGETKAWSTGLFQFQYATTYLEIERMFHAAVNSHDTDALSAISRVYPFHINTLLQLSEISKHNGNIQEASEINERALYVFEKAFHPIFNLASTTCGMDYLAFENRAFFLALYRHINYVQRKGCWRTCLELCKALLALDPDEDPMGALLMIDYFAIKAEEFQWIFRLWAEMGGEKQCLSFPNLSYNVALAMYLLEKKNSKSQDLTEATRALRNALIAFPSVVPRILEKCATTDSKITDNPFFAPRTESTSQNACDILQILHAERCANLWKEPETLAWLRKTASTLEIDITNFPERAKASETLRESAFPKGLPLNYSRHIFVSDFQTVLQPRLPQSALQRRLDSFDPMPPDLDDGDDEEKEQGSGFAGWLMGLVRGAIGRGADAPQQE